MKIQDFRQANLREMSENKNKIVHTFGALAELGYEVANKGNFLETIRTSLHLARRRICGYMAMPLTMIPASIAIRTVFFI